MSWLVALLFALCFAHPAAAQDGGRGLKLLHMQGCTGCHSLDGRDGVGPTLAGRMGGEARVVEAGRPQVVAFDADYVARSLRTPEAALAQGYPGGVMPAYVLTDEQLAALTEALAALPARDVNRPWLPIALGLAASGALALLATVWWRRATRAR